MIDDSGPILDALKNTFDVKMDNGLNEKQEIQRHLIQTLLTNSIYWYLLENNFGTDWGRSAFRSEMIKVGVPPGIRDLVVAMVTRAMIVNLDGQAIGKQHAREIARRGALDLDTLEKILGGNKFILGTATPTSIDADV